MAQNPWEMDWGTPQQSRGVEIPGGPTPEQQAQEARAQRNLELQEQAAARAAQGEARAQAEFEGVGGKPTEAQAKASVLLTRIKGGFGDIQNVVSKDPSAQEAGLGETVARTVFGDGLITRQISGADRRIVTDAQRDILDGLLTLGTGAAYNKEQLEGQTLSYFPQYGDTPEEVAAKNQRMFRLIEAAKINAGPKWAEVESAIAPFMAQVNPAETPQGGPALGVAEGETYSTDQDISIARQLSEAWKGGASLDQMNALSAQLTGTSLSPDATAILNDDTNRQQNFAPASSGKRSAIEQGIGEVASSPLGSYAAGATNALTVGMMDELAPLIGLDANQVQIAKDYLAQKNPIASFAGEVTGGALAMTPTLKAAQMAGFAPRTAALAADIAYGAGYGAGETNENRLLGAAMGGTVGGVTGGLARRFLPGATPGGIAPNPAQLARQTAVEEGAAAGIPVMTSDVIQPTTFMGRTAQRLGERIPFVGTGGARATQQEARTNAVKEVLSDFGGVTTDDLPEKIMTDLAGKRSAELDKFSSMKRDVITRLGTTGAVPVDNAQAAIGKEIAGLRSLKTQAVEPIIRQLEDWGRAIEGQDLTNIERLRKQVGEAFKAPELAAVRGEGEAALSRIYGPLRQDMGDFIKANGEPADYNKWMVANKRLSEMSGELKQNTLRSVLKSGDATPEAVERLLFSAKPSEVRALFRNLTPSGRTAAQGAIMARALKNMGGDLEAVSPEKFITQMRKLGTQTGVFFSGDDAARINGLVRALKTTGRAGEAGVLTKTGQEAVPFIGAGAAIDVAGGAGLATGSMALAGLLARAYESKATRNLLLSLGRAKPGSEAESKLAMKVADALKSMAVVSTQNATPNEPEQSTGLTAPRINQ